MAWDILKHVPKKKLVLACGDGLLILGGLAILTVLRPPSGYLGALPPLPVTGLVLSAFYFSFYLANLYVPLSPSHQKNKVLARLVLAVGGATALVAFLSFIVPTLAFGRQRLIAFSFVMLMAAYAWRLTFEHAFIRLRHPTRVLIVGAGWAGKTMSSVLATMREFHLIGFIDDDADKRKSGVAGVPIIGGTADLVEIADRANPQAIVLAITHERPGELFHRLLDCKMAGIELYDMPTLYEELTGKVPVNHVRNSWFVYNSLRGIRRTVYVTRLKRLLDVLLSFGGLVLSAPLTVVTALAILVESGSPILYRQKRVGQNEKELWLLKFRSMLVNAEDGTGAVWAAPGDNRVTNVGRVIRLLRIDEIPQMWNVLKGEMSFIGPRPERPEFVKELEGKIPYYSLRHMIKPGITGWAQVNYPYGASEEDALEKLQYDLYYLKNMSALLDLHILLRTIRVVLFRQGSR
jgi:sugar transferase (PEP-CTERM system associated)